MITGCAAVIVGHPLDTVKVNLQTQNSVNPRYRGTLHCLKSLIRHEGIRGVYRGVSSPLAGVAAINAIVFGVYGNTQRSMSNPDAISSHFMAGCVSGLFQSIFSGPMELAKTKMQVSGDGVGVWKCLKDIYGSQGTRGIFRGFGSTILRDMPGFGAYFASYEYLTRREGPVSTGTMLLAGGIAGVISWVVVYPIDVLKSRLQADGMNGSFKYKNLFDCYVKSVKYEGYAILTKGITPTIIRAFPTNAACFTVVTWSMRLMDSEQGLWRRCNDVLLTLKTSPDVVEPA